MNCVAMAQSRDVTSTCTFHLSRAVSVPLILLVYSSMVDTTSGMKSGEVTQHIMVRDTVAQFVEL